VDDFGFRQGELRRHGDVSSTMDLAREHPPTDFPVTFVARSQSRGRGRFERPWLSPPVGGLYLTVRIPWIERPIAQAPLVSMGAALALARLANSIGCPGVLLKWPNDLLLGGRKAAGILAEMVVLDGKSNLLVGVGIDVSVPEEALATVGQPATSFAASSGRELDPEWVLRRFLEIWSEIDLVLQTRGFEALLEEYRIHSDLPGRSFLLSTGAEVDRIRILSLQADGSLKATRLSTGEEIAVHGGELLPDIPV
jgi:BirA family biotin operon repressor/biotin-[acetyl-CoA-carboxylase] ligase